MSRDLWDRIQDARIDRVSADAAASVAEMGSATADSIGTNHGLIQNLFALDRAQSVEIARLRAAVTVLVDMLIDAGALDESGFKYRLEAEIDRVEAERAAAAAEASKVQCYSCGERVEPARTQVDAMGTICDRCFNGA